MLGLDVVELPLGVEYELPLGLECDLPVRDDEPPPEYELGGVWLTWWVGGVVVAEGTLTGPDEVVDGAVAAGALAAEVDAPDR